jgi:uncharacterized protein (DUF302 family)
MYAYKRLLSLEYSRTIERVREELKNEGFGVLTEIDVKRTFKTKLDIEYDDYMILGACNPSLAYRALRAERDLGVMLPCNIIVYRLGGETFASAILPTAQMAKIHNPYLISIAKDVEQKLKKVIDAL